MSIQLDFGGFDPIFPGVSIHFSRLRAWEIFDRFNCSPSPPPVDRTQSADEQFVAICVTTVLSHEVRHFHDSLISAYGTRLLYLRFQALLNLYQLSPLLLGRGANCLPVPLSRWCSFDDRTRKSTLASFDQRRDGKGWIPPSIPHINPLTLARLKSGVLPGNLRKLQQNGVIRGEIHKRFESLLLATFVLEETIRKLTNRTDSIGRYIIQPWQIFELSGLLVQLEDINQQYGSKGLEVFLKKMGSMHKSPYAEILLIVQRFLQVLKQPLRSTMVSASVLWSILGSYTKDGLMACPAERFIMLWRHLLEKGVNENVSDWRMVFDQWSRLLKVSTVSEGLAETRKISAKLLELGSRVNEAADHDFFHPDRDFFIRVCEGLWKSRELMTAAVQENPAAYIDPSLYLNSPNPVDPLVRYTFPETTFKFLKTGEDLQRAGYHLHWAKEESDGFIQPISIGAPYTARSYQALTIADGLYLFDLFGIVDFMFASDGRANVEMRRAADCLFSDELSCREII